MPESAEWPSSDNEPRNLQVHGRTVTLPRGSKVFVGRTETGDGIIAFTNNEGVRNAFGLSSEAFDALKVLLLEDKEAFEWRMIVSGCIVEDKS